MGAISYPLYVIHMPIIFATYRLFNVMHQPFTWLAPITGCILLLVISSLSLALHRHFDSPVRLWLIPQLDELDSSGFG